MINPTKTLETTAIVHFTQLASSHYKYFNTDFYATTGSLKSIYLSKYTGKGYVYVTNPFKAEVTQ